MHSASCCQQGCIIPVRLLKSDYVVCLQIKNSPGHLWHLRQKSDKHDLKWRLLIYSRTFLTSPIFFRRRLNFLDLEGAMFHPVGRQIFFVGRSGFALFCRTAVLTVAAQFIPFSTISCVDILVNRSQRLSKLVMVCPKIVPGWC